MEEDKWLLKPYFTELIEEEFPELIEARKEYEAQLQQHFKGVV